MLAERILPAAYWRTKEQRLKLVGELCPACEKPHFPPRDICPYCQAITVGVAKENK